MIIFAVKSLGILNFSLWNIVTTMLLKYWVWKVNIQIFFLFMLQNVFDETL